MKRKIKATLWNDLHPDHLRPGLVVFNTLAIGGGGSKYFSCGGGDVEELEETARRIAALWNAGEDIGAKTKEIEDGVIQFAFELGECHAEVINAALERIEKLKAGKSESDHALGFAIDRVKHLEAEKAEMLEALKSIHLYGTDTISGRVDGADDREWQREAVKEMTRRAEVAIGRVES